VHGLRPVDRDVDEWMPAFAGKATMEEIIAKA
jgi:hypothetical protein